MRILNLYRLLIVGLCSALIPPAPSQGRFLQADPIGYKDQTNLYAYVGNDPLNHTDPDGQCIDNMCPVSAFFGSTEYNLEVRQTESRAAAVTVPVFAAVIAGPLGRMVAPSISRFLFTQTASTAYRQAVQGGRNAGFLRQVIAQADREFARTIRSLERNIALHEEKIANPERYMIRDNARDPVAVARAREGWRQEIRNYTRQKEIAQDELRRRSLF